MGPEMPKITRGITQGYLQNNKYCLLILNLKMLFEIMPYELASILSHGKERSTMSKFINLGRKKSIINRIIILQAFYR